jgi:hypothetical protein
MRCRFDFTCYLEGTGGFYVHAVAEFGLDVGSGVVTWRLA